MPRLPKERTASHLIVSFDTRRSRCLTAIAVLLVAVLATNSRSLNAADSAPAVGLHEDGRVGRVVDRQGIVTLRPALQRRWTPVARRMLLKPGDWLRTDVRGANAARVELLDGTEVTLGPGSLLEVVKRNRLRLLRGEFQVQAVSPEPAPPTGRASQAGKRSELQIVGPDDRLVKLDGKTVYRVEKDSLTRLDHVPIWLQGFEGSATQESLGSLIANVDGRNVPLTIGYHKVSVEIRDQIARTTIEESFVNHTGGRLEGVFYFPLPQDASIAGFGMWINGELVEADVVEKQRAREIYETILRERRDPALLEWTGGNVFKARVFPILGHSEKRIKITYTQVLPSQGNRYRYSYGLRSEMLQRTPLRELAIDVKVSSAAPLQGVACPTHAAAKVEATKHSGHVEFTAQEFTPRRDFEVVVETDGRQSDVVVIPHRRVDDGYLLLQLTPPGADGNWRRETLADGEPIELLILADTSASMDDDSRTRQSEFIASLLACLSPEDRFNVAFCDVECDWLFAKQAAASDANLANVRDRLDNRPSLGWTDLQRAFQSVSRRAGKQTHVVYIGDGVVTAPGDDPIEFAQRVKRLYAASGATFHAVTVSSSYESVAIQAIASIGGGSVRDISGETGPQATALELLNEMTRPGMRDVRIEFRGFDVAGVYPDKLPNTPAGSQQIVLARYLPQGRDQQGEVVVTGVLNGEPVRYTTRVALADAESGNSFIPRLWARQHLDHLLSQGVTQPIQEEILRLSEEYHIITPYTSLLVLESDDDRERFGVKRRFQMRDGEKFFAQGRDNVNYDLLHEQMKTASDWRLNMRQDVLRELSSLSRDIRFLRQSWGDQLRDTSAIAPWSLRINHRYGGGGGGAGGSGAGGGGFGGGSAMSGMASSPYDDDEAMSIPRDVEDDSSDLLGEDLEFADGVELAAGNRRDNTQASRSAEGGMEMMLTSTAPPATANRVAIQPATIWGLPHGSQLNLQLLKDYQLSGSGYYPRAGSIYWVRGLFPPLPEDAIFQFGLKGSSKWSDDAVALSKSLLRADRLKELAGGLRIVRKTYDASSDESALIGEQLVLCSPSAWLDRVGPEAQYLLNWCNESERGVLSPALLLGRVRQPRAEELGAPPLGLQDYSIDPLHTSLRWYDVEMKPQGDGRVLLQTGLPTAPHSRVLIDTRRNVILRHEHLREGKVVWTTTFSDFVEVAGSWWATSEVWTNETGKPTRRTKRTVTLLQPRVWQQQMEAELAIRDQCGIIRLPAPSVAEAKQRLSAGTAGFSEYVTMILHFALKQRWDRVDHYLAAAEQSGGELPGLRWVRYAILQASRRHEELRTELLAEAARLAKRDQVTDVVLAGHILQECRSVLQPLEMLELLDSLKVVYERQGRQPHAMKPWTEFRIAALTGAGEMNAMLRLLRQVAIDHPDDYSLQNRYATALSALGDYPAAYAWLEQAIRRDAGERKENATQLRGTYTHLLREQGKYEAVANFLEPLVADGADDTYSIHGTVHAQYLSALFASNQIDRTRATVFKWLALAKQDGELSPSQLGRLNAAIAFAKGEGFGMRTGEVDPAWTAALTETARHLLRNRHHISIAATIIGHRSLGDSAEQEKLTQEAFQRLSGDIGQLPAMAIGQILSALSRNSADHDDVVWTRLAANLRDRWQREETASERHRLGVWLAIVYRKTPEADDELQFLREQVAAADQIYRYGALQELFAALLRQDWSAESEDEAFGLLESLGQPGAPVEFEGVSTEEAGLKSQVLALYAFTDRMVAARYRQSESRIESPERLTRTELKRQRVECLWRARDEYAARLREAIGKHDAPLADWLRIEAIHLDMRLHRNFAQSEQACWEYLGDEPKQWDLTNATALDIALFQRHLATVVNLSARRSAKPDSVQRLIDYFDRGIARKDVSFSWKLAKYQLLIALDRPEELEPELRKWIQTDSFVRPWQISLANLLAEQGRLDEAITLYEAVQRADDLVADEYRNLANWYLAKGRREDYERAQTEVFTALGVNGVSQWLEEQRPDSRAARGEATPEISPQMLLAYRELLRQASRPERYLYTIESRYAQTRDFRLLAVLADAVVGQTAGTVYPFLGRVRTLLDRVEEEAAVDAIAERIATVREQAETPVDQRALDFLQMLAHRHAATLVNQPQPHIEAAVSAMRRAFDHAWSDGERTLAARFLAGLGKTEVQLLAEEQRRQLRDLFRGEQAGTTDRLHISQSWAETLWAYNERDQAARLLESSIREFDNTLDDGWPRHANTPMFRYAYYLGKLGRFADAERVLQKHFENPANGEQRYWFMHQLNRSYEDAIKADGLVSHGRGQELYEWLQQRIRGQLSTASEPHRDTLVKRLCSLYQSTHLKLEGVDDDLREFSFEPFNALLQQQNRDANSVIGTMLRTIEVVNGHRDRLEFLIYQVEHEPPRFRQQGHGIWQRHGRALAESRRRVDDLGVLEPRLLKIVAAELESALRAGSFTTAHMYHKSHDFWTDKEPEFRAIAEKVYAEQTESGRAVQHIAVYLYKGLSHYDRAIEMLLVAQQAGLLSESAQAILATYLQEQQRWQESIAILRPLIRQHRDKITYTVMLMRAYSRTGRDRRVVMLLNAADKYFRLQGRWTAETIGALADGCMQTRLHQQAAGYYREVISLHERTQPNSGTRNRVVSTYYTQLSQAYARLEQTSKAIDAAASAVVIWGRDYNNRQNAMNGLAKVIRDSKQLDEYVRQLDAEAKASGKDRPIIRKALGTEFSRRRQYKLAVTQLRLALELQPNDDETHNALVTCYEQLKDGGAVFAQLLKLAQLKRHDISLYERMARVCTKPGNETDPFARPASDDLFGGPVAGDEDPFGRPDGNADLLAMDAKLRERVLTSIVEVMPNEASSHQKLAQIREEQNRWEDAMLHWKHVHRIRSLEPAGLLGLAKAQIHQEQWDAARETLRQLKAKPWPARFRSVDAEVDRLLAKVSKK